MEWTPDKTLIRALERYVEPPREGREASSWEELLRVAQAELGEGRVLDEDARNALSRHAMLASLVRSGVPGLDPTTAQALAARFPDPRALQSADEAQIRAVAPELPEGAVARLRSALPIQ